MLTDRGSEYVGNLEQHEYELYLALENIDHTKTKVKSPQTNGICERFHKTILNEFYRVAFRKRLYASMDELQADLDGWLVRYNEGYRQLNDPSVPWICMCCIIGRCTLPLLSTAAIASPQRSSTIVSGFTSVSL